MPSLLLVEDQRFFLQVFRTVVGNDFPLYVAMNAEDGWKMYLDHAPDIAFLDVQMPGLNGHTLATSIQSLDGDAFTVMVTGNADQKSIARARANHVRGVVVKPYSKKKIFHYIDRFMMEQEKNASAGGLPVSAGHVVSS